MKPYNLYHITLKNGLRYECRAWYITQPPKMLLNSGKIKKYSEITKILLLQEDVGPPSIPK